jgi:hypothetical protein
MAKIARCSEHWPAANGACAVGDRIKRAAWFCSLRGAGCSGQRDADTRQHGRTTRPIYEGPGASLHRGPLGRQVRSKVAKSLRTIWH